MALTIPNIESAPTFDGQSVPDATDWAAQSASEQGTGVVSGMQVIPLATPSMGASVQSGTYQISGVSYTYTGGSVAVTAASVSDRRDIVTINGSSASVTAGIPCGTAGWTRTSSNLPPVKPSIPSATTLLGEIYVANTTASVGTGNIIDKTTPVLPDGFQQITFTASVNTWTVPTAVTMIELFLVAPGGGGGGGAIVAANGSGGGGGGGQVVPWIPVTVTPGQVLTIQLGVAGTGGGSATAGNAGTSASVTGSSPTVSVVALGGKGGGSGGTATVGGTGGNYGGGSGGGTLNASTMTEPGNGQFGGGGMGGLSTTVAGGAGGAEPYFGYGGGGGGGAESGGTAGTGGGSSGGSGVVANNGSNATANTGGGGGGGASFLTTGKSGGNGAGGYCAIKWWQ